MKCALSNKNCSYEGIPRFPLLPPSFSERFKDSYPHCTEKEGEL